MSPKMSPLLQFPQATRHSDDDFLLRRQQRRRMIGPYGDTGCLAAMTRRRRNPNWGRPTPPAPVLATEFELKVRQLQRRILTFLQL